MEQVVDFLILRHEEGLTDKTLPMEVRSVKERQKVFHVENTFNIIEGVLIDGDT